ncbi:hypothetical protein [Microbacterium tumbae]
MIDVRGAGRSASSAVSSALRTLFSRRALPAWITIAAMAACLTVLVVTGGLDETESVPEPVALGTEVRLSTYAVTVLDVEFADAVEEEFLEADPGETLLVVTMRMENLSDRAVGVDNAADRISSRLVNVAEPLLALSGAEPTSSAAVWRDDGSAGSVILQPSVPAEVRIAWPVSEADVAEEGVQLDVYDAVAQSGQIILASDVVTWRRAGLVARIDLGGAA